MVIKRLYILIIAAIILGVVQSNSIDISKRNRRSKYKYPMFDKDGKLINYGCEQHEIEMVGRKDAY